MHVLFVFVVIKNITICLFIINIIIIIVVIIVISNSINNIIVIIVIVIITYASICVINLEFSIDRFNLLIIFFYK